MTNLKRATLILLSSLYLACFPASGHAQHSHGVLSPSVTFPPNDSALKDAPRMITMSFRVGVRLLKLTLHTDTGQWLDIGFRYDPARVAQNYAFPLPGELPSATYYVARWSVVDERQRFLNGEFKFSFGPGAVPPSETIESLYSASGLQSNLPDTGSYIDGRK